VGKKEAMIPDLKEAALFVWLMMIVAIFLLAMCSGCSTGGWSARPFVNPMVDEPKFPDNYGVKVEWTWKG
jgi:hypothetical protein